MKVIWQPHELIQSWLEIPNQGAVWWRGQQVATWLSRNWEGVEVDRQYNTNPGLSGWLPLPRNSISQQPLCHGCHAQPPGAAILTCFDEAGWMEGGAGADGTYNLEGVMWLALSRAPLYVSDSRKPPLPRIARISIIPVETKSHKPCTLKTPRPPRSL